MINHIWTVLCSKSVLDQESNNLSLIELYDQVNVLNEVVANATDDNPILLPASFELVNLWVRADRNYPERGQGKIKLLSPSGRQLGTALEFVIDLTTHERTRMRSRITGLPISSAGLYTFAVEYKDETRLDWIEAARVPLLIVASPTSGQTV